jgi:hypothetical protein
VTPQHDSVHVSKAGVQNKSKPVSIKQFKHFLGSGGSMVAKLKLVTSPEPKSFVVRNFFVNVKEIVEQFRK